MQQGTVYICHAVDTEGPLNETLDGTFNRIYEQLGIRLKSTKSNLQKLREKSISLNGYEESIAQLVRADMVDTYLSSWDQISLMHEVVMSKKWREQLPDSDGEGYVISWHCMDHVNYENNPRGRAIGFHAVYEYYERMIKASDIYRDQINFHFHPPSLSRDAHRVSMGINLNVLHNEILARRIIDKKWFPTVYRPGSHTETMDINLWLEQWIPFDIANLNTGNLEDAYGLHPILGRFGDWRESPTEWIIYNPDVYDYRKPGSLKRYISRVLNLNTRYANISKDEIRKAFIDASKGKSPLLSITNHDFRDMKKEVEFFYNLILEVAAEFSDIKFKWCNAVEGFRAALGFKRQSPLQAKVSLEKNLLYINTEQKIWGHQPFLALKTREGRYYRDDFICDSNKKWRYVFDEHTINISTISDIGIAFNDNVGNVSIYTLNTLKSKQNWTSVFLHENDWIK